MAFVTVTGFINTFDNDIASLPGLRLFFVPSGNAVSQSGKTLFVDEPAQATVSNTTGGFSVELQEQSGLTGVPDGDFWYYPRIEWLDSASNYKQLNFIAWRIRVPDGGGDLGDFIDAPPPVGSFVLGYGPPPEWLEDVIYIDRDNGDVYPPIGSF